MNLDYLTDGANWAWSSSDSFPHRLLEHLGYTSLALLIAAVIALPIGLYVGHTNRAAVLAINLGNAGQAVPTLGLLMLMLALLGLGLLPVIIALAALAVPPLITTTYAGLRAVPAGAVDAAVGMGMRPLQVLVGVEIPAALPIIVGGLRNATLQVVSSATIAAYAGMGGLGRYLFDGLAVRDYPQVVAGSVVVAVLAIALDLLIAGLGRWSVSPGLRLSTHQTS
ncbi:MAG: ABC transporter permease [Nocardioides sp.]|uniref:ABC transporter permease n=1 Tax=Nocardioides sp. TaxID=35761 RepID=UPI0039E62D9A